MTDRPLTWDMIPAQELGEFRYYFAVLQQKTRRQEYHDAACTGKHRFESRDMAESTIKNPREIHSYHCPDCKGWHVGSRVNYDRKKRLERDILKQRRGP